MDMLFHVYVSTKVNLHKMLFNDWSEGSKKKISRTWVIYEITWSDNTDWII